MTGIRCPLDCGWTGSGEGHLWLHLRDWHDAADFIAVIDRLRDNVVKLVQTIAAFPDAERDRLRREVCTAVAAGRREAAQEIRDKIVAGALPWFLGPGAKPRATDLAEWAARIAEGGEL